MNNSKHRSLSELVARHVGPCSALSDFEHTSFKRMFVRPITGKFWKGDFLGH